MENKKMTPENRKYLDDKLVLIGAANLKQDKFANWAGSRLDAARKLPAKWGKQTRAIDALYAEYKLNNGE